MPRRTASTAGARITDYHTSITGFSAAASRVRRRWCISAAETAVSAAQAITGHVPDRNPRPLGNACSMSMLTPITIQSTAWVEMRGPCCSEPGEAATPSLGPSWDGLVAWYRSAISAPRPPSLLRKRGSGPPPSGVAGTAPACRAAPSSSFTPRFRPRSQLSRRLSSAASLT
jgi:hypothetical protein